MALRDIRGWGCLFQGPLSIWREDDIYLHLRFCLGGGITTFRNKSPRFGRSLSPSPLQLPNGTCLQWYLLASIIIVCGLLQALRQSVPGEDRVEECVLSDHIITVGQPHSPKNFGALNQIGIEVSLSRAIGRYDRK